MCYLQRREKLRQVHGIQAEIEKQEELGGGGVSGKQQVGPEGALRKGSAQICFWNRAVRVGQSKGILTRIAELQHRRAILAKKSRLFAAIRVYGKVVSICIPPPIAHDAARGMVYVKRTGVKYARRVRIYDTNVSRAYYVASRALREKLHHGAYVVWSVVIVVVHVHQNVSRRERFAYVALFANALFARQTQVRQVPQLCAQRVFRKKRPRAALWVFPWRVVHHDPLHATKRIALRGNHDRQYL